MARDELEPAGRATPEANAEGKLDFIASLTRYMLRAPAAILSLQSDRLERQVFMSLAEATDEWMSMGDGPLALGQCRHVTENGRSLIIDEARPAPSLEETPATKLLSDCAYIGVPIFGDGAEASGVLCVIDAPSRQWTDAEIHLVTQLASMGDDQLRLVVSTREAQERKERAETLTKRDTLTGMMNRTSFQARLRVEKEDFDRTGRPLSLVQFELDYFHRIREHYGADMADVSLKRTAATIVDAMRENNDAVARLNDGEFAIVLPRTSLIGAQAMAERIREAIERSEIKVGKLLDFRMTASFGVSCIDEPDTPLHMLVKLASDALETAKESGGNCVVEANLDVEI